MYHEILRLHFRMPTDNFHFSNSPGTRVCFTWVWSTDVEALTSLSINQRRVTNPRQASHWSSLITWPKWWPLIGQFLAGFLLVGIAAMRVCLAQSNLMICLNNLSQGPYELLNSLTRRIVSFIYLSGTKYYGFTNPLLKLDKSIDLYFKEKQTTPIL